MGYAALTLLPREDATHIQDEQSDKHNPLWWVLDLTESTVRLAG